MSESHEENIFVALSQDELWTILKLLRDGEATEISKSLETKIIMAYHDINIRLWEKDQLEHSETKQQPIFDFPQIAVDKAWEIYLKKLSKTKNLISHDDFKIVLHNFYMSTFVKKDKKRIAMFLAILGVGLKNLQSEYELQAEKFRTANELEYPLGENPGETKRKAIQDVWALKSKLEKDYLEEEE